jgi:hypothetical protein
MSSSVEKRHQTIGEEGSRPSGRNFVIPIAVRRAETPFETGFAARLPIQLSRIHHARASLTIAARWRWEEHGREVPKVRLGGVP